ncbi:proline racemase family protein [Inhella proteolytica]|uniref:Proline racemase family protein n=1 Tax=Inhella proteolytica TaxID=2795029 RepID=A0A931J0Z9_9BURK|nr:proline racemase family protein [Inhella proteolytica]MBH9577509.1 proline racemase family protein [Inhella proteolytica]
MKPIPALDLEAALRWQPPAGWTCIEALDAHTAGEPLRIILAGWPDLGGGTVLARRRRARAELEPLRRALMWEPRGHADMYGCVLMPPERPDSHIAVLFTHNEGYSSMCGHGIVAVVTAAFQCGLLPPALAQVRIDSPAGLIEAEPVWNADGSRVQAVRFRGVPSWVLCLDDTVDVPGLGRVRFDIAYGGAFYAYVEAGPLGLALRPERAGELIDAGRRIKQAVAAARRFEHPEHEDLGFLYGTIFTGPAEAADAHSRQVCIFADGELDRSPTGTGVCGRAALLHARGELAPGQAVAIESILGTRFGVQAGTEMPHHGRPALRPLVEGSAFLTGRHRFFIDPADPLGAGFLLR